MVRVKTFIIWLSMISGYNELEVGTKEPEFVLEYQDYLSSRIHALTIVAAADMGESKLLHIHALRPKQRIDLCYAAKKFAGILLEAPSPITTVPMKSYQKLEPVLRCDTLPVSYLRIISRDENKWGIVLDSALVNTRDKYNFDVKTERSKPNSCSESIENDPLNIDATPKMLNDLIRAKCFEDPLVKMSFFNTKLGQEDFLALCLSARIEISKRSDVITRLLPSIRNEEIDPPQMYDFGGTKQVAFQCQSTPPMYIHFKTPQISEFDVQVTLFVGDSESEPKTATQIE